MMLTPDGQYLMSESGHIFGFKDGPPQRPMR
jgi:hypothetical protein